jgi:hypothetical protein
MSDVALFQRHPFPEGPIDPELLALLQQVQSRLGQDVTKTLLQQVLDRHDELLESLPAPPEAEPKKAVPKIEPERFVVPGAPETVAEVPGSPKQPRPLTEKDIRLRKRPLIVELQVRVVPACPTPLTAPYCLSSERPSVRSLTLSATLS